MIKLSPANKERPSRLREVFRQYAEGKRALLDTAERCSFKGWPDRKAALQQTFLMQALFSAREAARFEYLMDRTPYQNANEWKSIPDIFDRLVRRWGEDEDVDLQKINPSYRRLLQEIEDLMPLLDKQAVHEPFLALQRDAEYVSARLAMVETLKRLNDQLAI